MPKIKRPPKLSHHKASGQAYVTWKQRRYYLGPYGSRESAEEYARFLTHINSADEAREKAERLAPSPGWITIVELCAAYLAHAEGWYQKDGQPTTELDHVKRHIKVLVDYCETLPVAEFGAKRLKSLQAMLVDRGHSRVGINARIAGIKRIFRWGESEELVPEGRYHALATVRGLVKGRTKAPERPPVLPIDDETVAATLPFMPEVVADMVRFQRATGCRPAEVRIVRPCDVDRSGDVWVYRPSSHKTEHHGKERLIFIGPVAQGVLQRYLLRDAEAYCFSPAESVEKQRQKRHEERATPLSCGNRPGSNKGRARQNLGALYTKDTYNRAITRACRAANRHRKEHAEEGEQVVLLEAWCPNRLRHTAATQIRREFDIEAAQVVLGHSKADVTQIYAERDAAKAREVAKRIG